MTRSQLGVQDALWLNMDRPNSLMVIDTVMWFRQVPDWDKVEEVIAERLVDRYPVFSRRPVKVGSQWYWEEDPGFDLADHVHRVMLPDPGTVEQLQAFVASQRSVPLDRCQPMWVTHLIDNVTLADGTEGAAVMLRFHHAIADGIRLVQVALGMTDMAEPPKPIAVGRKLRRSTTPMAIAASAARNIGRSATDVVLSAAEVAEDALITVVDTVQETTGRDGEEVLRRVTGAGTFVADRSLAVLRHPERLTDVAARLSSPDNRVVNDVASVGKILLAGTSVETVWSGVPGIEKGACFAPMLSLDEVKQIRRATATTVNDVLLAAVSGTITRYLREHGEENVDEVLWMVPVSIKAFEPDQTVLGNHFALVLLRMPIGIDDVRERLEVIHERMERIKTSDEALLTFTVQRRMAQAPTRVATSLTNFFANKGLGVLTNVPGPTQPVTLAGTEVEGVLGWAPCSGDQPMTVCIFSYNGKVAVGFGTDATLIPDGDRLGALFAEEFAQMYSQVIARVS